MLRVEGVGVSKSGWLWGVSRLKLRAPRFGVWGWASGFGVWVWCSGSHSNHR